MARTENVSGCPITATLSPTTAKTGGSFREVTERMKVVEVVRAAEAPAMFGEALRVNA